MPGSGYGQISFTSAPTFSGTFTVSMLDGFQPNPGDSFVALRYPSAAGDFTSMEGLDLGGGLRLDPRFTKTGLTLTAAVYPTNALPSLAIYPSVSGVLVLWPVNFTGWELQCATNLAAPEWTPAPVAGTNNTVLPVTSPQQFFRLNLKGS